MQQLGVHTMDPLVSFNGQLFGRFCIQERALLKSNLVFESFFAAHQQANLINQILSTFLEFN